MHTFLMVMLAWVFAAILMAGLWLVQRRTNNAGIVDVGWSLAIALMAAFYAADADTPLTRRVAVAALALAWGLRLALHIHWRSHGKPEDGRYRQLRAEWAPREQWGLFKFFQFQALATVFFSIPFLLIARNAAPETHLLEWIGLGMWAVGWIGETAADAQLEQFKRQAGHSDRTCREGLWRYSRHPNYFFESLVWCALAVAAWPAPHGYLAILCPAAILYFLFRVTGIPATEAQALRTKGDDYRDYQRTTSAFVPWFPKKSS